MNIKKWIFFLVLSYNILQSYTFATPSHHIAYTDQGHGQPLVLIHAFPTDQELWRAQQKELQYFFRVITLDLWGFGRSSSLNEKGEAITMTEYAHEVKTLLDELHIQKIIIGGESMGGYIALAFLEKYPTNILGVILADTQAIADSDEAKQKREGTALEVLQHGTQALIKDFMPKALSPHALPQTKEALINILDKQKATAIASALRGMALRKDATHLLAGTPLPILIITGDEDALISPEQSRSMHRLAKNSQLVVIPKAGHLSSLEQAERWNEAVISYFK